jgi:hypothetical protein
MSDYKLTKSTMERYDIRLQGEDHWRCAWATISISDDGVFNAQTDCGNFNYYWGSPGKSFKSFLMDICSKDTNYLYRKIARSDREGQIDVEKTINNMKARVIQNRQENRNRTPYVMDELSPEEARELWDALDCIENNHSEISSDAFSSLFYYELPDKERSKVFSDEWWYDDILVTTEDIGAKAFCEVVAPVFAEILKSELEVSQTQNA